MSNSQTVAERMPHDLSHLGFLAGQIGRLITISTTPVHAALPIFHALHDAKARPVACRLRGLAIVGDAHDHLRVTLRLQDRKSTRLNSSHANISYAVFGLRKKMSNIQTGAERMRHQLSHLGFLAAP